ncbi:hypothetical protein ACWGH3_15415 [Streptomyces sp. NPDC054884]|uniref:hypothetical protein n=1 Tax=Streptomyces sp. ME08-AFT2 TaxID=3028683 RepID=UPI0029A8D489|nr:hypothetical protein [Streptomyces sp. ME08-AFT2]MDX3314087.1 hypothetical protein [Streptomyces sp. ME08-AFT2]
MIAPPRSKRPAELSAATEDVPLCAFSAEGTCAEPPLTSEPPLPDAEPLTSEPPLAAADSDSTRP